MAHTPAPSRSTKSDTPSSIYDQRLDHSNHHSRSPSDTSSPHASRPANASPRTVARNGPHPLHYAFAQAFGERAADAAPPVVVQDADMITAVQFNTSSDMVATGDKGGRIVILRRVAQNTPPTRSPTLAHLPPNLASTADPPEPPDNPSADENYAPHFMDPPEFRFWTQFQSHEPEFDYLKSMEIEEKINQIRWCRPVQGAQRLIATNDKTIKMWRVYEKEIKTVATMSPPSSQSASYSSSVYNSATRSPQSPQSPQSAALATQRAQSASTPRRHPDAFRLRVPRIEVRGSVITATSRRVFSNAHAYHINSISLNSDEETFLSADDLRVNLWNLNASAQGFNILDIKPDNMEDLTEVITSAEFHPTHCHLFVHSTSRGVMKLSDLRESALCKSWARQFEVREDASGRASFFSEIIASISDVKFSPDGRYILTRDYMNLRLWDMNMENAPVLRVPVHDHLRSRLCDLYENDCIFDKFQCSFSSDGGSLLTGSYNSLFQSYSALTGDGAAVEANVDFVSGLSGRQHYAAGGLSAACATSSMGREAVDPSRRILHLDSSPDEQIAAVAAGPALYLYYGAR